MSKLSFSGSFTEPLSEEQTKALIDSFLSDQSIDDNTIYSYLMATANRQIEEQELIGAVKSLREHMLKLPEGLALLDTAGTGGSGLHTFNTSTAAAFVCAAAGVPVAKHGNRAASSLCGSADVIEALGISLELSPEQLTECLRQTNFCFMFAPRHHASTKRVAAIRKQIGKRTIFNFLGPLCNPAQASYQIIGVSDPRMLEIIAGALPALGIKRAMVLRGDDGLDEISLSAETEVYEVKGFEIINYKISPQNFGFNAVNFSQIEGRNAIESAKILRSVLRGEASPYSDLVALNAGAGLYVSGKEADLLKGVEMAKQIIKSGQALLVLDRVVEFCK